MSRSKEEIAEYNRKYRLKNRKRLLAYDRERWQKRKDTRNAERRSLRKEDPAYRALENARCRESYYKYQEKRQALASEHYHANASEINKKRNGYFAKYREENRELCRERCRPHYRHNKAKRRAAILQRTPPWADTDAIRFFYECCPEGCHVDHIIPLRGKNISGLHVPENLQWVPELWNLQKGNSFYL